MFRFLTRPLGRKRLRRPARQWLASPRPLVEALEGRDSPTGLLDLSAPWAPAPLVVPFLAAASPVAGDPAAPAAGLTAGATPAAPQAAAPPHNLGPAGSGLESTPIEASAETPKPRIINFGAVCNGPRLFSFVGTVVDANPGGLTVTLGGIPSLAGVTVVTAADGSFGKQILLAQGEEGVATAQVTNAQGETSDVARCLVLQPGG